MIGFYSIYKFGLYYVLVRMRHPNKSERYLSFNPLTIYSRKKNERKSPSKIEQIHPQQIKFPSILKFQPIARNFFFICYRSMYFYFSIICY